MTLIFVKGTNYEAPHHTVFSILLLSPVCYTQIFSSALVFKLKSMYRFLMIAMLFLLHILTEVAHGMHFGPQLSARR